MTTAIRVLVVTGGHPFDAGSFFELFDADAAITWHHVEQPAARGWLHPDRADDYDVAVLYDMPGIEFTRADPPLVFVEPPADHVAAFEALLAMGKGMVFLHHAIAGWPLWDDYAEIVGGRFHYQPARLRGVEWPDSGYRHDVRHRIGVVDGGHPVCAGIPASFELVDEVYLCPVFGDDVVPLLRSDHRFTANGFWSADLAIRGRRDANEGWDHPPGSNLVGWAKHHGRSPIVYLQFGDGPSAHGDPHVRRLVANAVAWAASDDAHRWARDRAASRSR